MEVQVSFSSDGEAVLGVLHVPDRAPAPGLIMCHGFTGHKGEGRSPPIVCRGGSRFLQSWHGGASVRFPGFGR